MSRFNPNPPRPSDFADALKAVKCEDRHAESLIVEGTIDGLMEDVLEETRRLPLSVFSRAIYLSSMRLCMHAAYAIDHDPVSKNTEMMTTLVDMISNAVLVALGPKSAMVVRRAADGTEITDYVPDPNGIDPRDPLGPVVAVLKRAARGTRHAG